MGKLIIEALKNLMCRVPGRVWLAAGGLLVGAFWFVQHDARIRQQARLQQLQKQASAQMASLRKQAEQDVKQANVENAKAIAELEQRRQQLEKQNQQLSAQLTGLRWQAQTQAGEVATLPISQIVTRVATQLGLNSGDVVANEEASSRKGAKAQNKLRITNDELQNQVVAAGRTADIANSAISAPPDAPHGTGSQSLCDLCGPKASAQRALRSSVSSVLNLFKPHRPQRTPKETVPNNESQHVVVAAGQTGKKLNTGVLRSAQDDRGGAQDDGRGAQDEGSAALALTSTGARKVETALVELNACESESKIETQQISNCQARAEAAEGEVKRLQSSVASLNQALQAKDKILARQQAESKAELRAARGTFLGRLARTAEHVAIGVAMGVAIGVAAR